MVVLDAEDQPLSQASEMQRRLLERVQEIVSILL